MKTLLTNILTGSRIVLTPVFIYFLFWGDGYGYAGALLIFILASLTDIWTGARAGASQGETPMGKTPDPWPSKGLGGRAFSGFLTRV